MSADLVHESRSAPPRASDIEAASLNSGDHETKADGNVLKQSEIYPVDIEAIAKLARFYAVGTPPEEEFRSIKEHISATGDKPPDKQKDGHLTPKECQTAQQIWSHGVGDDPRTAGDAFKQRTGTARERLDFSAELRALEAPIRIAPCPSGFKNRSVSARALMRGRISHAALFSFAVALCLIFGWHSHEAKEIVSRWTLSADQSLLVPTRKSPPALATSSELLPRGAVSPEVTVVRHSESRFDAQQKRMYADGASNRRVKQNTRSKRSSTSLHFSGEGRSAAGNETANH
jgi:hypothetical protein